MVSQASANHVRVPLCLAAISTGQQHSKGQAARTIADAM